MKITALMLVTNAVKRGDTFREAIKSHLFFADEIVVVDGCSTDTTISEIEKLNEKSKIKIVYLPWPEDFNWMEFATHANFGYEHATGDWVATGETDHIIREKDAEDIRKYLEKSLNSDTPVVDIIKNQVTMVDRYFTKARIPYFLNKKYFGNKIGYGWDKTTRTDLGKPIFVDEKISDYFYSGKVVQPKTKSPLCLFNYIWTFKTFDMIVSERLRANKAWNKFPPLSDGFREPEDLEQVKINVRGHLLSKYNSSFCQHAKEFYPQIMIKKIQKDLQPGMYGYDVCGLVKGKFNLI